ncbi:hypothetical protein NQ315_002929 [Exocentrus adspersus]|uniref:Tyr recombinase domain-containing protein n=1 Tax=Exocentrus adspersus TaxID=1586481 RepID=A0AAV8V8Z0_9CUCU|nr:hypothetical protein NQ315_002929 [Exocentrus adspersus]
MNDNVESFSIPAEIKQEAQEATLRLLPAKSKRGKEPSQKRYSLFNGNNKTKKAKILERNQIEEFLKKAPDVEYLQVKVALILGVAGACRCNELTFLDISDVQDKGSYLYVLIPDTKTNISRSFTVMEEAFSVNAVEMCRKYISLRPKAAGRRFFLRYVDGKCTTQHVGINTISKTFSKVASFLGLPDPESFTGHGMRRSSATLLANAGG